MRRIMFAGMALAMLVSGPLHADSKSSSSSSPSSRSWSSPSTKSYAPSTSQRQGDFAKPSPPPQRQGDFAKPTSPVQQPTTTQRQGDFAKPGQAVQPTTVAPRSATDTAIAKGQSKAALAQFQADQQRYKAPPVGAPVNQQAAQQSPVWRQYGTKWESADAYYADRQRAERSMPPQVHNYYMNSPWVSAGPPSYGQFSTGFLSGALLGMIGTASYDSWAYSHRYDPDYIRWHRDMERQASDDPELRDKIAKLDAKVAELESEKAPVTDKLPDGIDPALVVAPQTVMLATSHSGFNWWLWIPVFLIVGGIVFVVVCVSISRNRQRFV